MLRAKKSLGQNFLHNKDTLEFIVEQLDLNRNETVVEIGGGTGNLTKYLLELDDIDLKIVEIDDGLANKLKKISKDKAKIINKDILNFPLNFKENLILVGNIPYYITKPIIKHIYRYHKYIKKAILMVQYEVAKSLTAAPSNKKYNAFTVFVKNFAEVKFLKKVNRGEFTPRPKVDSAVISLNIKNKKNIFDSSNFIDFLFICFRHKRKTLSNNLKKKYGKQNINNILKKNNINLKARAEELPLDTFKLIYSELEKLEE
ncbi:MAG: ribosomal RNA small subunit methyltransferase A [Candidatus Mcinerneyibacterium aminivorans]|uniref:Ribosomal RNA small subunit methyltransferase A n=1 Tax=Candidatus Mcinerneyibacterium aminivorans TaxID=2703815 RepID=A0A5D0MLN1_9BACT|nr:MAG: ribosomal RNA small subunit methyltransferase A [Candidatus Mcinerneyibacterium aminivorans]